MFPTGLEFAVETLKSFILAMALIDNHLTVEKAVSLSRLELEFQVWRSFLFVKEFTLSHGCFGESLSYIPWSQSFFFFLSNHIVVTASWLNFIGEE